MSSESESAVIVREQLYIDGEWRSSMGANPPIDVLGAATGIAVGRVPDGTQADVDAAVAAARRAFTAWATTSMADRLDLLRKLEDGLAARADELAALISSEVGTPLRVSRMLQAEGPRIALANYRELLPQLPLEEKIGNSLVVREPLGVVACITAWNYPLQQVIGKVGAALATGCTAVLKPSEMAPLSAFVVADLIHEAGFPAGVFNLVSGSRATVGQPLVSHPEVDMIHFTGSTGAGRHIGAAAALTVKRTSLELGGKSPNVILDDADLELAVKVGVANCFTNTGQTCTAWSRMLVHRSQLAQVEAMVAERASKYRLGDPLDPNTNMGPLASEQQQASVREHIVRAIADGARMICGGPEQPAANPSGYFVAPTAFSDVTPTMALAQEEVFGPVLAIMPYDTEDEAVEIANSTIFGLAGGVWSADTARAERVARRIRSGQMDINGSFFNPLAPFGGHKQSGVGRELGVHGLLEFYELTSLQYA
jgi:acyl-CoA reductase-like NAD-dependent aldehyde dehydrogenase